MDRHHIDPTLKDKDPVRYRKYLPEDVVELTRSEHKKIHMTIDKANNDTKKYGHELSDSEKELLLSYAKQPKSEEHKRKISESNKGKHNHNGVNNPNYGKKHPGVGGRPKGCAPTKGSSGMHWFNNGTDSVLAYECPEGYVKGRIVNTEVNK